MQQVNVFIETSSRFRGNVERKCGYVLSTQLRTGKETREHFGRVTGTYHQAILLTMVDALDHIHIFVFNYLLEKEAIQQQVLKMNSWSLLLNILLMLPYIRFDF